MGASVYCTVRDYKNQTSIVTVDLPKTATMAKAKALADFIKDHTCAKVLGYGISQSETVNEDKVVAGKYDRVAQKLVFGFSTKAGASKRFSIPAPIDGDVDADQEGTSDLAEDVNDLLQKTLGSVSERMRFNGAYMLSKKPRNLKTEKTGV